MTFLWVILTNNGTNGGLYFRFLSSDYFTICLKKKQKKRMNETRNFYVFKCIIHVKVYYIIVAFGGCYQTCIKVYFECFVLMKPFICKTTVQLLSKIVDI